MEHTNKTRTLAWWNLHHDTPVFLTGLDRYIVGGKHFPSEIIIRGELSAAKIRQAIDKLNATKH